ncbi:gustatory receptor for sugar taste 64f-like [Diaphorina citri]|uniref:Gustatory receptor for sugar taste 64f-like n=1 Tax=Diaphorina citri TaxID=121845 RepID=A0A3Q0IWR1_DIACI|nr:gustatory receptor for sugar taste 64f-like [Diaphorina citri]
MSIFTHLCAERPQKICWNTVRVYEYSKTPLSVLYGVHQRSYCTEVELFTQQILRTNTCLSGSHMFSMNRNFLLTIAGTIITFELVLMQLKEIAASI